MGMLLHPKYKNAKPTYRFIQLKISADGIKIDIDTIAKLVEIWTIFLSRDKDITLRMISHYEEFPEFQGLNKKHLEELMVLSLHLTLPSMCILGIASDIYRYSKVDKYDERSVKAFRKNVSDLFNKL
jgi:hypothetical protein